ncbi:MAG: hypothetical protein JEZ14_14905 [Marinilabiliaceae bacterium]|nr:hypothetical protein [Marinilabiliaceae bacterium]
MDKEFLADYYECNMHIVRCEYETATEIMSYYIIQASSVSNPDKALVNKAVLYFIKNLDSEFPNISAFTHFIKKLVTLLDKGRLIDPSTRFN